MNALSAEDFCAPGDPDPTPTPAGKCPATALGLWLCTRDPHPQGTQHVAGAHSPYGGLGIVAATWTADDASDLREWDPVEDW